MFYFLSVLVYNANLKFCCKTQNFGSQFLFYTGFEPPIYGKETIKMIRYSNDFKRKVVMRYAEGESVKDLAESIGAGESSIYEWIAASKDIPIVGFQKTIRDQENKIARLEAMLNIIKSY